MVVSTTHVTHEFGIDRVAVILGFSTGKTQYT